ncbi:MutS-related protein [Thermoanaerobacterium butyriciformans]|uniref:DNA mismatch repair ATPase MutS n=1 Tax=Thermoanaerobacterium butyriciformans TaxID=1702242 RepID=A0ABS4NHI9_9THEO|nr:DNA mismatch repair protein MutS [Thermoanaerobacterium butyriciformans]MBP2073137.1 DNA mismatch repair ATPase MutS [Thermoanaerobacterium butyriciformans]
MAFQSILFLNADDIVNIDLLNEPVFFKDLNIDQIVDTITFGRNEYNLKPFFYKSPNDIETIKYRQEIMRDLENNELFKCIKSFSEKFQHMREDLKQANKLYYKYQKERWFLDAVDIYCDAVVSLANDLTHIDLNSTGFVEFREYILNYVKSDSFISLNIATKKLEEDLSSVKYSILIRGNSIKVGKYDSEVNYSHIVEETFKKFKEGEVKDYRKKFSDYDDMNHVEAKILDLVAQLYKEIFDALDDFCIKNTDYVDKTIGTFEREIQFYMSYLEFISKFKDMGLKFCYPKVDSASKEVFDYGCFDLALANKLISNKSTVVTNDFYLSGKERIFVVSGPNQGGKTTFARTFGQVHYFASIGCPIPGYKAQLFLYDNIFTHFEREENVNDLHGKLEDELIRIYDILSKATSNSIVILNEIFTSTTLKDAIFLSKRVMDRIIDLDLLCVWVTFIDELSVYSEKTVSVVNTVVPDNPSLRTYKVIRKPADGLSYAITIAEKYRLTYEHIKERVKG